jgi:hypothetical protein
LIQVILKNTPKKRIETLMVGMEDWTFMRDVNTFHGGMAQGTTFTFDVQPPRHRPGEIDPPGWPDFRILASVFEDKTADGDAASIDRIIDDRACKKLEYARLLDLIESVERKNSGEPRSSFKELVRRVDELPDSTNAFTGKWVQASARSLHKVVAADLKRILSGDGARDDEFLRSRLAALKG